MYFWIVNCSLAFLLCVFCAGIVIPQILLIAFRKQLFDLPDERKIHHCAVPRLGGIAFKPVVFFSFALLLGINMTLGHSEMLSEISNDIRPLAFVFCSIMVLYLVGMADDLIGIRYRAKFVIQILCGVMLIVGGIYIDNLHGILGIHAVPLWLGYPLTILIVVFIINAINLIDGIDGLASGLCSIACLFYGLTFFMLHQHIYAMLAFATLGVLVPFFYYNVFGNPEHGRKIFMGDTGSLTVGMMLCFLSLKLIMCGTDDNTTYNPMVLAFSPLLVPCCDVVRVYLHRVRNGKNPFLPDKNHIHHKLLALGIKQRNAMIIIISVSTIFILFNVLLSLYLNVNWIVLGDILIWTLANIRLTKRIEQVSSRLATDK
ncbi:undecaprenyl/decaprenyl-phosphate alpha-N-acetylglucosaminyl 1-phosphate transferase [Bacteroides uniformis]|uniref:Undecaprenyl/decaprenyl-phosphate alpha-N-acetylglucosaminyl 1-phosphate transferase n=2 Tax=Bacteroides uniformis TaxID=820 RepID=A0A7J5I932_BACUN|nr:MraY family glycosyltransferase [Bacteroides uniformis]KAB4219469.1 undecaprenyl/decaprenyl-phosphate alpha-N-acetylglucosaminyl 1-phosphate transferase [Bacteroides uniformis]KAB4222942.1 undecaprenyl/decaprenyl-phosphate alpha-N-acetylglucosaminyl 1-phosphate transferase [Bacteroides uniformis]KAB4241648.1 undecaprenyl/decaprenyl-phosphate alpha-N-acetylglucosaminyl 1-phosphate transferase [Bacteroides uniformis]RYT27975.1 undecaprenyl/decaprenyl-phosphate alpha-N-acetylglucosaminyl 1-phos